MEEIKIGNRTLQFKVCCEADEAGIYNYTEFYYGTRTVTRKKWIFWGETITKEVPVLVFTIYQDINSPRLTKEYWRREIGIQLDLLNRRDQLTRKEYI